MANFQLSNLQLRSNLLSQDNYQEELRFVTAAERKDILHRAPLLPRTMTQEQQNEWRASLFDGDKSVSLSDGDRGRAWLEQLAEHMEDALSALADRADAERVWEVLCVAESLAAPTLDSTYAAMARPWAGRCREILGRREFGLTAQMIDDRLTELLGHNQWRRAPDHQHGMQGLAEMPATAGV